MLKLRVSVVVPTYNRAHSIGAALDSILAQDPLPDEVIVVDDGSTDNTSDVLAAYGDRITVLRQKNAGAAAARNAGIRHATSEWVAFLDSDDLWRPGRMAVLYRDLSEAGEDIVGHTGDMRLKGPDHNLGLYKLRGWNFPTNKALTVTAPLAYTMTGVFSAVTAVRRELLLEAGGYRENVRIYEDAPLFCRLALKGKWLFTGDTLAEICRLPGDTSALSLIERNHPIEAASARVAYVQELLDYELPPDLQYLVQRKLSGALLILSAAESSQNRKRSLSTLIKSARQHPSFMKGWLKILPPVLLGKLGFKISLRGHKAFTRS